MLSVFRRIIHSKFGAIFAILFLGVIAAAFILGDVTSGQFGGASLSAEKFWNICAHYGR